MNALIKSLDGKAAIITGASSGIGRATALALAEYGVAVVLTGRREQRLIELAEQIKATGGRADYLAGDAADPATADAVVALVRQRFSRLDFLVHCAGQGRYQQLVDTSVDEFDELMRANLRSSFLFCRAAAPYLIEQRSGNIVIVSSIAGLAGKGNEAVYTATKFAQVGFAQSLDEELRGYGIKVSALCPGGVKTEFAIGRGRTAESVEHSPMMRPEDVANAIVFTCMQPPNVRLPQIIVRHMGIPFA